MPVRSFNQLGPPTLISPVTLTDPDPTVAWSPALDNNTDYIIQFSGTRQRAVTLSGGRNMIIRDLKVVLNVDATVMLFSGNTAQRIVHVENFNVNMNGHEGDCFKTSGSCDNLILQLKKGICDGPLLGSTNVGHVHADFVQTSAGILELWIEDVTFVTAFDGIMTQREANVTGTPFWNITNCSRVGSTGTAVIPNHTLTAGAPFGIWGASVDDFNGGWTVLSVTGSGATKAVTFNMGDKVAPPGSGGGSITGVTSTFWNMASAFNLVGPNTDTEAHVEATEAAQGRPFAGIRKNYFPDAGEVLISDEIINAWDHGRRFIYTNGKPNLRAGDSGNYWNRVAAGAYDAGSGGIDAWINGFKNDGRWTSSWPVFVSFHHEQSVISEDGAATGGAPGDYGPAYHHFRQRVFALGAHMSQPGGCIALCFVPHWRQLYSDPNWGTGPTGAGAGAPYAYRISLCHADPADYDVFGADVYLDNTATLSANTQFGPVQAYAQSVGKPWITGEMGVDSHAHDAATWVNGLDTLLATKGVGWGSGKCLALCWTNRVTAQGDDRFNGPAITTPFTYGAIASATTQVYATTSAKAKYQAVWGTGSTPPPESTGGQAILFNFGYNVGKIRLNRLNSHGVSSGTGLPPTDALQCIRFGARSAPAGGASTYDRFNEDQTPLTYDWWSGDLLATNWYSSPPAAQNIGQFVEPDSATVNYSVVRPVLHSPAGQARYIDWPLNSKVLSNTRLIEGTPSNGDFVIRSGGVLVMTDPNAALDPGVVGSPPALPSTNDGVIHRWASWQLYPAFGTTAADKTNALAIARQCDVISGQFSKLSTFPGNMYDATVAQVTAGQRAVPLVLMPYHKSVEFPTSQTVGAVNVGQLPYQWYAHNSWAGDISLESQMVQNSTIHIMMADTINDNHANTGTVPTTPATWWKLTLTDPTGATVDYYNWKELNSRLSAADVAQENTKYASDPWKGIYYDSAGPFAYTTGTSTPIQRNGSAYATSYDFLNTAVWPMGDAAIADNPTLLIWANGLPALDANTSDIASHFHGVTCEGLFSPATVSDYPTETNWKSICNHMQKMQVTNGTIAGGYNKYVQLLEYATWGSTTTAAWNNFRRFLFASYHIMNRGKLFVEFVRGTGTAPATATNLPAYLEHGEDAALYDFNLGAPLVTQNDVTSYAVGGQAGLYARKFTNGVVLLNFATSSRTYVTDRNLTLVNPPGVTTITKFTNGASIPIPPSGTDGTGVVTARFFTTSDTPPPPVGTSVQDRIASQSSVTVLGAAVVGTSQVAATDTYTHGAQSFRSGFESGSFSEYDSTTGTQISVATGHPHTGTQALKISLTASGTSYAEKLIASPPLSLYGRCYISISTLFNANTFLAHFITSSGDNQTSIHTNAAGDLFAVMGAPVGSATPSVVATLYTLLPADLGQWFRFEWFTDFTDPVTGFMHAWLYTNSGSLIAATGTNNGNTTSAPLSFTGANYVQTTMKSLRVGVTNSTPTAGLGWIDDVAYNDASLGRVGA